MANPNASAVRGNSGIVAKLAVGVDPAVDYSDNIKAIRLTSEDKDDNDLTFAEAALGDTKDYSAVLTAVQATAEGTLWRLLWDNPGAEIAVTYGPHGNAVPTVEKPHFLFTVKADGRPEIGTEARRTKDRGDFEYTAQVTSEITLDEGAGA